MKHVFTCLLCILTFVMHAQTPAPIASYPFTGNANDAVGSNHGTVNGATLTSDRFGNANSAYSFDGVDDYIGTANLATNQTDNWTMTAWVKPTSISQNHGTIVMNGTDNGITGNGYAMVMGDLANTSNGNIFKGLLSGVEWINSGFIFNSTANWYFTSIVREAGITKLYFNGILSATTTSNIPFTPSGSLRIGSATGIRFWNGAIDEVKIYNNSLTASQIQNEYVTSSGLDANEWPVPVSVVSGGTQGTCNASSPNNMNGGAATGAGCGGGGAGYYGGHGGNGLFGGGGGGAAGFTLNNRQGGQGGDGVIALALANSNGNILSNKLLTDGTSFTIPAGVSQIKVFAIGAGGGGAGATGSDGTSGGGGAAGGVAFKKINVTAGDVLTYSIGTGGAGGVDMNNGSSGTATIASINSFTITGNGGSGGLCNTSVDAPGGTYSGGDGGANGGNGKGTSGDTGGGAGGALGGGYNSSVTCAGGVGSNAQNIDFLFGILGNTATNIDNLPTLIAHYPFNGNVGDSSGNNLNGTIIGSPTFTIDKKGNANSAILFNGNVANRVEVDNNLLLHTPSITIASWVKFNSLVASHQGVVDKPYGTSWADSWHFGTQGGNWSTWIMNNTNNLSQLTSPIVPGQWYYVVSTFDNTSKQHKLYIDGVLKSSATFNDVISYDASKMYIGAALENGSVDYPMDGAIDEVKIYGEALSPQQVQNAFINELTFDTKGSGHAISFDGSDDYIQLPPLLNGATQFSIDFWIKTTENRVGGTYWQHPTILGNANPSSPDGDFGIVTNNGQLAVWHGLCCGDQSLQTTKVINDNQWHHIAVVNNGSTMVLYADGMLLPGSIPTNNGAIQNSALPWRIGANNSCCGGVTAGAGTLDEFRFWNTALTETQIRERMCRKLTNNDALYSNLVGYFNFDENFGSVVQDASSNANLSVLFNGASRVTSGAPIGNTSSFSYTGAASSVNHVNPSLGDDLSATLNSGNADGLHVYHVNEAPNSVAGVGGLETANTYFGTFVAGGTSPTYSISYNYDGIANITNENGLVLATRADNSVNSWNGIVANLNTTANTLNVSSINNSQAEYRVAALDPGLVSSSQSNCFSYLPNPLTATPAFNNNPATTYQWQDSIVGGTWQNISGATSMSSLVLPLATSTKYYRRLATLSGTTIPSNEITIEAYNAAHPSTVPNNQWNLYAYDGASVDSVGVTFKGSYTRSTLGINTVNDYGSGTNPSLAAGYAGCNMLAPGNIYSLYAKRKGFPTGSYALNIPQHDDVIKIYVDGVLFLSAGCCNNLGSQFYTLGTLNNNSVIECRMTNSGGGPGHLVADIFLQNLNGGTIGSNQSSCSAFTPSLLTNTHPAYGGSTSSITYQWQISSDNINFTDIPGETGLTYQPSLVNNDTYYRRKAMNPNNEVAYSNVVHLDLTGPTFYADIDGDGYGDPNNFIQACSQPIGYLTDHSDCNDTDTTEHPGQQWYIDNDNDGYCVRDYGFTPLVQCSRPLNGKVLSELIGTPFPSDCDDNDPGINPANQYMTVTGVGNYTNSLVFPLQGASSTTYYFEAIYFDLNNALPPASFPRVFMDYENDGFLNDVNDKALLMTEFDANDQTTSDGKKYIASISGLKPGTNWVTYVSWNFGANCRRSIVQNAPDVLVLPNLQTFASDITFSNPSPEISSPQTITATVKNQSDFAAQNVVVHLTNQIDTNTAYPDITIPNIPANSSLNVSWNITTPALLGIVPMQVTVDYTDVIAETNELDNSAVASYNNGNAPVSGGIIVDAYVSPTTSYASANNTLTLVFNAAFFGANLPPQLKVAGAPVSFQIVETGTVFTGFTGSDGNINIPFTAPVSPGEYHISGTVTSPPFVGDISPAITKFTLLPGCKADYTVDLNISAGVLVEGQARSIQVTVKNEGCMDATDSSKMVLSIPGAVPDQLIVTIPPLAKNATYSLATPWIVVFPSPGPYSVCAQVDVDAVIDELNEANNQQCKSENALANAPDLVVYQGSSGSAPNCNPRDLYTEIHNVGGAASVASVVQVRIKQGNTILYTYTKNIPALNSNGVFNFIESYQPANNGNYEMEIVSDFTNQNTESDENNNVLVTNLAFTPCAPDLIPTNCHVSTSANDYTSGTMTLNASFENIGVTATSGPITVRFKFSDNTFHDVIYSNPVQVNEKVDVSTTLPAIINPNLTMNIELDPNNTLAEVYESNNELSWYSKFVAWDFFIANESNPCMVFIGNKKVSVGSMFSVKVPVVNKQLHTADTVKVNYKVSGPGIIGQQDLGTFDAYNVNQGCGACPSIAQLGTLFLFAQEGTYTFTVTVDPDNVYAESNEGNNVLVFTVLAKDDPDMYMESVYINPSLLNPAKGQNITVNVSYANLAKSNLNDQMELKLIIDGVAVDSAQVSGLTEYTYSTHNFTTPWSSTLAGVHVIKAIIDSDSEIDEVEEDNNEATRAITVGSSANLKFNELSTLNVNPALNDSITIKSIIQNEGDLATNAVVDYFYVNNNLDTILINTLSISVPSNDTTHRGFKWKVADNRTTILAKIKNSTTLEFNYNDNNTTLELGSLKLYTESLPACLANNKGSLTAHVIGGEPPYNYSWSNGSINQQMQDTVGTYSITVVDFTGQQITLTDSIPVCLGGIVHVKSYLQGFYQGGALMSPVLLQIGLLAPSAYTDTVAVSFCAVTSGNPVMYTTKAILHADGSINCHIPFSELGASRYIKITHRNSIETWSANPVTINNSISFNFTTDASQAFGNNLIELEPGIYGCYSGDINQDGVVDGLDYNEWEIENNNFGAGYLVTDLNGDGIVDGLDFLIWETNSNAFVGAMVP